LTERPLYGSFAWAYDLLVRRAGPSVDWIVGELHANGIGGGDEVVDAGCGTGDHAVALARRGYRMIGVDRSPELLRTAREKGRRTGADLRFAEGDLLTWRPPRHCDAVLCRGVLNDITEEGERGAVLSSLAAMLRPGGVLVADVRDWETSVDRYARSGGTVRSMPVEGGRLIFRSETVPDHERRLLLIRERLVVERGGEGEEHVYDFVMRPWSRAELEERLAAARFEAIKVEPGGGEARADRLLVTARLG
jgi:SAM-dependent methyltransferase